jgi:hypothetical protein
MLLLEFRNVHNRPGSGVKIGAGANEVSREVCANVASGKHFWMEVESLQLPENSFISPLWCLNLCWDGQELMLETLSGKL